MVWGDNFKQNLADNHIAILYFYCIELWLEMTSPLPSLSENCEWLEISVQGIVNHQFPALNC